MWGIFDHARYGQNRPLALVAKHSSEDVHTNTRLYNTFRRFMDNDIYSQTGLNLKEFLDMPREFTKLIMDVSTERRNRKNATASDIERRLRDELNGGKS